MQAFNLPNSLCLLNLNPTRTHTHTHTHTDQNKSFRPQNSPQCFVSHSTVHSIASISWLLRAWTEQHSRQIELKVLHVQSWKWLYGKQRAKDRHLPTRLARNRHRIRLHLEKWLILAHLTDDGVWLREWVTGDYRKTGAGLLGIERVRTALSRRARCL